MLFQKFHYRRSYLFIKYREYTIEVMSGNTNRSLTDRIRTASNRTNYWYKLQLEEERRQNQNNVTRPILADPSEERTLYERVGSLAVYRDGVLYLSSPILPIVDTSGGPTPESIWWVTNFTTDPAGFNVTGANIIINSTNETNSLFTICLFTYGDRNSYLYNRDGTVLKDLNVSSLGTGFAESLLTFTSNDGKTMKLLHFRGARNGIYNMLTPNFTRVSMTPRIALSANRVYSSLFYNRQNANISSSTLQILDINDTVLDQITSDIIGGSSLRYDAALIITDQNGNYITNVSMRTTDLSDNNAGNSIAVRGINTFSDDSVILSGDFSTQEISFFSANNTLMDKLTLPVRKTNGGNNNRDIFMASFNSSGTLRYYNYIRSTNQNIGQNEFDSSIAVDSNDNTYVVGTFINAGSNLMQFFAKNTSLTPLTDVVYDTSGFQFAGDPNNNCNFSTNMVFLSKYNYNGDFQWFAPMGTNSTDLSGDVSYLTKITSTGIVLSMLYASATASPSSTLNIYNGKTVAQRNTPGVIFRFVPLVGTSLYNNIIIKYDFNGNGVWVKQIRGDIFYGSIGNIQTSLPIVVDGSNNIYNVCSIQGNASLWDIGSSSNTQINNNTNLGPGSNPYIISLSDSGNLNWYATIIKNSGAPGTYATWSRTTSNNDLLVLFKATGQVTLNIYNSTNVLILTRSIVFSANGPNNLLLLKISSDGNSVSYIKSRMPELPIDLRPSSVSVNNGISIDSSNNVYITGELGIQGPAPDIGQTMDLINQDNAVVATVAKRSANQFEYFTVKIPASFTQE